MFSAGALAAGQIAADVGIGLLGRRDQRRANKQNIALAREQMAFQERMRDTAYQAAAKDLEKAGLNRILALGSPAASPSGQTATVQPLQPPKLRMMELASAKEALKNLKLQGDLLQTEAAKNRSQTIQQEAQTVGIQYENVGRQVEAAWMETAADRDWETNHPVALSF